MLSHSLKASTVPKLITSSILGFVDNLLIKAGSQKPHTVDSDGTFPDVCQLRLA